MKKVLSLIILSGILLSCGGSGSSAELNESFDSSLANAAKKTEAVTVPESPKPDSAMAIPAQNTVQPTAATPAPTAPGMNPPHGQPGHRCDIAVGAPLNSKPAATTVTQPAVTATTTPVKTAPGMNPPHGQPGHHCDIAVGAPLNSKPAAAVQKPAAGTTPVTTPAVAAEPSLNRDSSATK